MVLTWSPLPNDPEIWNNEDTATRQYRITYDEYTKSDISERIYDTTHPWHEIEGLQAGRGYQFVIAATSNLGPGVKTDYYCIRLLETGITRLLFPMTLMSMGSCLKRTSIFIT